ncbi:MAG: amidohydrolase, partial [Dehalococcoidia bacterium]
MLVPKLAALAVVCFAAIVDGEPESKEQTLAFVNVNVVPMDREVVIPDQTVMVRGGRIVSIAPAAEAKVPAFATRIDGSGKFLMPGLADMHVHT